jgi:hypothetical protein
MYTIYIKGFGAEITQGTLPIDTVSEIYSAIDSSNISLEEYLLEAIYDSDQIDWFEIDSNFHSFGAIKQKSELIVENSNTKEIVFQDACVNLTSVDTVIDEIYPENVNTSLIGLVGVLTCVESSKGTLTYHLNVPEFDPSLLEIHCDVLGTHEIIQTVRYQDYFFIIPGSESTEIINFSATLEE